MSLDEDRDRLSQIKMLNSLTRNLQITDMLTVYSSDTDGPHNYGVYCCLVPNGIINQVLSKPTWDFSHGDGAPGSIVHRMEGTTKRLYFRFGDDSGIEPLVIDRVFHGMRNEYKEISEEFRFFHGLYHDRKTDQYIKFDDSGNETVVAIVENNHICIRVKEIRQFLAVRDMYLSVQFDCREHSTYSLEELSLEEGGEDQQNGLNCWGLHYGNFRGVSEHKSFSRLLGKHLVKPLPKSKSGLWGFAEEEKRQHAEFIIGVDENGDEFTHTSEPDALANYFGANPDAPNYLTPVNFRKQVLDKYYQQPSKYLIEDSMLSCGRLWSLQIDNHHEEKVCAWLGDLGCDLPYQEQLHWRTYNIPPQGGVSETYFKQQILAEFSDSDRPEHLFVRKYRSLQKECADCLGWQLLLPLSAGDEHYLKCMRIPATDEQREFDELVLGLSMLLIDSLNEKKINKYIPNDDRQGIKGSISRLEAALVANDIQAREIHIEFLRKLQNLRSSSSAHRKGSNYKKIANEFGINNQNLRSVFAGIIEKSLKFLDFLIKIAKEQQLGEC